MEEKEIIAEQVSPVNAQQQEAIADSSTLANSLSLVDKKGKAEAEMAPVHKHIVSMALLKNSCGCTTKEDFKVDNNGNVITLDGEPFIGKDFYGNLSLKDDLQRKVFAGLRYYFSEIRYDKDVVDFVHKLQSSDKVESKDLPVITVNLQHLCELCIGYKYVRNETPLKVFKAVTSIAQMYRFQSFYVNGSHTVVFAPLFSLEGGLMSTGKIGERDFFKIKFNVIFYANLYNYYGVMPNQRDYFRLWGRNPYFDILYNYFETIAVQKRKAAQDARNNCKVSSAATDDKSETKKKKAMGNQMYFSVSIENLVKKCEAKTTYDHNKTRFIKYLDQCLSAYKTLGLFLSYKPIDINSKNVEVQFCYKQLSSGHNGTYDVMEIPASLKREVETWARREVAESGKNVE